MKPDLKILVISLLVAASCVRPPSDEFFVLSDGTGSYEYVLDMSDSLCVYDLSFFARLEGRRQVSGFPMKIYLTSPSGVTYSENVYYDASRGLELPYRVSLSPVEYGTWNMEARASVPGLGGLGLICKRNYRNGTRQASEIR